MARKSRSMAGGPKGARRDVAIKILAQAFSRDGSSRKGSRRFSSLGQQSQPLFVIHGLPRDKFLGQDIHSAKESQLDEKLHKIQVPKDQGAGLSHLVANTLQMGGHLGPVQARSVVMTKTLNRPGSTSCRSICPA